MARHMSLRFVLTLGLSVLVAATACPAAASDRSVKFLTAVNPPSTQHFDISWVQNSAGKYFLADRDSKAVDLIDATKDAFDGFIGRGVFVGVVPAARCPAGGN